MRARILELDERVCLICGKNEVEDETHFLLRCEAYAVQRRKLMELVAAESKRPLEGLLQSITDEPIKVMAILIGGDGSNAISEAVAGFCAGRLAWRDNWVRHYLDQGT